MGCVVSHRPQVPRPAIEGPEPEPLPNWRTFARAFLRLKAERDHLVRRNAELETEHAMDEITLAALRSRISSMAEENGPREW